MSISKKILIIAPHADDEVLGVGGTTQKFIREGHDVYLIICCRRAKDLEAYKECTTHFKQTFRLPFEDESLESQVTPLLKSIEEVYAAIKPDWAFIPRENDFNLDHRAVHRACEVVLRRYQEHAPVKIFEYEIPSSTTQSFDNNFKGNVYIPLTRNDVLTKIDLLASHIHEVRVYPNPRSNEGLLTYAKFRGMECDAEYAEYFNLIYSKDL
jgi:LmbE family N-acetylglucosaminyl deacetylase